MRYMRYDTDYPIGLPTLDYMLRKGFGEEMMLSRDVVVEKNHQYFRDRRFK